MLKREKKLLLLLTLAVWSSPLVGQAAEVWAVISPAALSSSTTTLVEIRLKSSETINAVAVSLVWPKGVTVEAVDDSTSLIDLWLEQPTPNQAAHLSGIMPGGFMGEGNLVTFRVKNSPVNPHALPLLISSNGTEVYYHSATGQRAPLSILPTRVEKISAWDPATDTLPPESFLPILVSDPDVATGALSLVFSTKDKGSGLARYEVAEKLGLWSRPPASTKFTPISSPYVLRDQSRWHFIYLKAVDNAGNERLEVMPPRRLFYLYSLIGFLVILIVVIICVRKIKSFYSSS